MTSKALSFKEEGNRHFRDGKYREAEDCYTQAITVDPSNPQFYTNRAFARVKLQAWDAVISDALAAIERDAASMKAYYYLAQAQLALRHPSEALSSALTAYELCIARGDASARSISALVLRAKKEKWEARERERVRRQGALLADVEELLAARTRDERRSIESAMARGELGAGAGLAELQSIDDATRRKTEELRSAFALADPQLRRREVPDWLIDNISFAVMHDPVVTKTGQSYDRATILEHLRRSETDPLTREPLRPDDLRPNIALRQACAEFLEENGWAVDW